MRYVTFSLFLLFSYSECLSQNNEGLFSDFPWLSELTTSSSCQSGDLVVEYNLGSFSFVHIKIAGVDQLYFEDGQLYCQAFSGFSCLEFYNLSMLEPSRLWTCEDMEEESVSSALFEKYAWLDVLLDEATCVQGSVTEYSNGSYSYIVVQNEDATRMYFQDGTPYCTFTATNKCNELYNLSSFDVIGQFDCGQDSTSMEGMDSTVVSEGVPWISILRQSPEYSFNYNLYADRQGTYTAAGDQSILAWDALGKGEVLSEETFGVRKLYRDELVYTLSKVGDIFSMIITDLNGDVVQEIPFGSDGLVLDFVVDDRMDFTILVEDPERVRSLRQYERGSRTRSVVLNETGFTNVSNLRRSPAGAYVVYNSGFGSTTNYYYVGFDFGVRARRGTRFGIYDVDFLSEDRLVITGFEGRGACFVGIMDQTGQIRTQVAMANFEGPDNLPAWPIDVHVVDESDIYVMELIVELGDMMRISKYNTQLMLVDDIIFEDGLFSSSNMVTNEIGGISIMYGKGPDPDDFNQSRFARLIKLDALLTRPEAVIINN